MKQIFLALAIGALASGANAAINYAGGTYTQNFDTLPTTGSTTQSGRGPIDLNAAFSVSGLDGWSGGNFQGSSSNTEFRAQDGSLGSSSGRGIISFGTTGSSERALGLLSTSNQISTVGIVLVNTTGQTLDSVTISYTGEQWRRGDVSTPDSLVFRYGLTNSIQNTSTTLAALNFTSPNTQSSPTEAALDGNAAGNRALRSATITGLTWTPGSSLALSWSAQDLSGQDDGLAIDNVQISAVPAPASIALLGIGGLVMGKRRR